MAKTQREIQQTTITQSNVQPTYDVYANVQDRDLSSVAGDVARIVAKYRTALKPGNTIAVKGQTGSMNSAFHHIALGLGFAAVFICVLMVHNFQTWIDLLVVLCALPLTVCGTTAMLSVNRHHILDPVVDEYDYGGRSGVGQLHPAGKLLANCSCSAGRRSKQRSRLGTRACGPF
jgi:multidrug efflux pump subunit AcrB